MRDGIDLLVDEIHIKRWLNQLLISKEMNSIFDKMYGKLRYTYAERERIKQLTFYLGRHLMFVSLEVETSTNEVTRITLFIMGLIGEANDATQVNASLIATHHQKMLK